MTISKKIKDWIYWQTPIIFLFITLALMGLGSYLENLYIFYLFPIPFALIFVWIFFSIKKSNRELTEENKKHKGMYIHCDDCKKYVDVINTKVISTHKSLNLVDRVEMIYSCGHKKIFSIQ